MNTLKKLITEKDEWVNAEGEFEGQPFLLRFRPHLSKFIESKKFTHRLTIYWPFQPPVPTKKEDKEMTRFEDSLVTTFEQNLDGVLAFVYTQINQKEWQLYVQEPGNATSMVDDLLTSFEEFPIECTIKKDANWKEYKLVIQGAEK